MTIYDFSTGDNNEYRSQLTVPKYEYYKKPLRPLTGEEIDSFIYVNEQTKTFTGLKSVTPGEVLPTDPQFLTNDQASRGVQFFFRPEVGYVDATFSVVGFDSNCTLPNGGALDQALIVKDDPTSVLTFSEFETLASTASAYYDRRSRRTQPLTITILLRFLLFLLSTCTDSHWLESCFRSSSIDGSQGHLVIIKDQGGEYDSMASLCDPFNTYLPPKGAEEEGSAQMLIVFKGAHHLRVSSARSHLLP